MTTETFPKHLHINDMFWTFQGEGQNAGRRSLFVRMPFCNLACTWCDTTFNSFERHTPEAFEEFATQEKARFAVITGGEPMMNKHTPWVVQKLLALGFEIAIETNGTFPLIANLNFITVSPKKFTQDKAFPPYYVEAEYFEKAHEFKYVVDKDFDFSILDRHAEAPYWQRLSLSPEFGELHENLAKIFEYIKENPRWKISLQTHKFMHVK